MPKEIVYTLSSASAAQTESIAESFAKLLRAGDCVLFFGELGAGKTTFIRGLARGLGIAANEAVNSPTFALIHEYRGSVPLYHFDLYRLHDDRELVDLCFEDYLQGSGAVQEPGVVVIEWAERLSTMQKALPAGHFRIALSYDATGKQRHLRLQASPQGINQERTAALQSWYNQQVRGHEA